MTDKALKNKAIKVKGKDYVLVSDRVLYFNENYSNGSIVTKLISEPGAERVIVKATVYPDLSGDHKEYDLVRSFVGHSQALIGDGPVNTAAALENAETSAVGRALAMMGIGVIESIASADEMRKAGVSEPKEIKYATPKQINWIRSIASKISGAEEAGEIDAWVQEVIGITPDKVPISQAKLVVDQLEEYGKQLDAKEQRPDIVHPDTGKPINLDDIPY